MPAITTNVLELISGKVGVGRLLVRVREFGSFLSSLRINAADLRGAGETSGGQQVISRIGELFLRAVNNEPTSRHITITARKTGSLRWP
jgi:hypothetical protein